MDGLKSELTGCPLVSTFRMCGQKVHSADNRGHLDHHIPRLTPRGVGEQKDIIGEIGELETLIGGGGGDLYAKKKVCVVIKLSLPGSGQRSGSRHTVESLR